MIGPYRVKEGSLYYVGNKLCKPLADIRLFQRPNLDNRHEDLMSSPRKYLSLIEVFDCVREATSNYMKNQGAFFFNLPTLTRMISSPGALTGTIPSDVSPFRVDFFSKEAFLTQSSQLYLELALCLPEVDAVYCWDKSFRNERTDFRHLPEFTNVEFEFKSDFEENLNIQRAYFETLVRTLCSKCSKALEVFLTPSDLAELDSFCNNPTYETITFTEAFRLLHKKTGDEKYQTPSLSNFGAIEEVLLTEILNGSCVFVTEYISDEVAFYNANKKENSLFVINADFLGAGYGELIGSGERLHTDEEVKDKAVYFELPLEDYQPYINSRKPQAVIHSGWGMGIERFIQFTLKLPAIWEASIFPRIDESLKP